MASKTLGRISCPIGCGNAAAHVKIKTDKASTAYPYIHCLGCGVQLHTRGDEQRDHLLRATRPEKLDTPPAPPIQAPTPPAPPPHPGQTRADPLAVAIGMLSPWGTA